MPIWIYIVLDALIAAIIAGTVISCVRRGFVRSFLKIFRVLIALSLALSLASNLSPLIKKRFILGKVSDSTASAISGALVKFGVADDPDTVETIVPDVAEDLLKTTGVNMKEEFYDPIREAIAKGGEAVADTIADALVEPIANALSNLIAFIVLFIVFRILITIAIFLLDKLAKLPVIRVANRLLGALFGVLYALFASWLIARGVVFVIGILTAYAPDTFGAFDITRTYLLRFFYHVNPLAWLARG